MAVSLVDSDIKSLIKSGAFKSENPDIDLFSYIQPASIDVPIGRYAYRLTQKFVPFAREVEYLVDKFSCEKIDLSNGAVLKRGETYIIPCMQINLPDNYEARLSPKSSIGRVDVLVRSVFDNTGLYDTVFGANPGMLWIEVSPQSFNVKIKTGMALNQLRVFDKKLYSPIDFSSHDFIKVGEDFVKPTLYDDKIVSTICVNPDKPFGFVAKDTDEVLDLTSCDNNPEIFFEKIEPVRRKSGLPIGKFFLEKNRFYILATKEKISVPIEFSVEMVPFSHLIGELRAHYAGFFDPGFGYPNGSIGVLEVRPHENIWIYDSQPICMYEIVRNKSLPTVTYGNVGNNYSVQEGPKLAKFFRKE